MTRLPERKYAAALRSGYGTGKKGGEEKDTRRVLPDRRHAPESGHPPALPFPLLALHAENGSGFINHLLVRWCRRGGISFTRGRGYRRDDLESPTRAVGAALRC